MKLECFATKHVHDCQFSSTEAVDNESGSTDHGISFYMHDFIKKRILEEIFNRFSLNFMDEKKNRLISLLML